jgi:hypothetical protein
MKHKKWPHLSSKKKNVKVRYAVGGYLRAKPPVEVKPVFGGKSSATNGKFTVFSGGILTKSGGKKYKNTSIFFDKKEVN